MIATDRGGEFYSAEVFAPGERQARAGLTTTQRCDVFARSERQATTTSIPEPHWIPVRLLVDGAPIDFMYTSFGLGLPIWAPPVLQSLAQRWGARPNWDGYHARPTDPRLAADLLNILADLMREGSATPLITPLADGGVQAEWHDRGQDLEIVVPGDGPRTYYYFNRQRSEEEEGELDLSYAHVQDLIGRVS